MVGGHFVYCEPIGSAVNFWLTARKSRWGTKALAEYPDVILQQNTKLRGDTAASPAWLCKLYCIWPNLKIGHCCCLFGKSRRGKKRKGHHKGYYLLPLANTQLWGCAFSSPLSCMAHCLAMSRTGIIRGDIEERERQREELWGTYRPEGEAQEGHEERRPVPAGYAVHQQTALICNKTAPQTLGGHEVDNHKPA